MDLEGSNLAAWSFTHEKFVLFATFMTDTMCCVHYTGRTGVVCGGTNAQSVSRMVWLGHDKVVGS